MYSEEKPSVPDNIWDHFVEYAWIEYKYIEKANGSKLDDEELYEKFVVSTSEFAEETTFEKVKEEIWDGEEPNIIE